MPFIKTIMVFFPTPHRALGQHYLRNKNLLRQMVRTIAPPLDSYTTIEIGPGPGFLTEVLLEQGVKTIHVIEKDARFLPYLEALQHRYRDVDFHIHHQDALATHYAPLFREKPGLLVGNLPYNISVPLIVHLIETGMWKHTMAFLVQKEVGLRLLASPSHKKAYSALSILVQAWCNVQRHMKVGPENFIPPPKVDSLWTTFTPQLQIPSLPWKIMAHILHPFFQVRRKMMRNTLKSYCKDTNAYEAMLANLPIPTNILCTARPEDISVKQWLALIHALSPYASPNFVPF